MATRTSIWCVRRGSQWRGILWARLSKLQTHLPLDMAILLLGIYPPNTITYMKSREHKRLVIVAFVVTLEIL